MESFFSRFKNPLVLIAILLAQAIALATQVRRVQDPLRPDGQHVRLVRMWASWMVSPFERLSAWTGHGIRYGWSDYVDLRHVRQQNEDLQKQLAQLRLERAAISEDAVAAERLRALLGFKQKYIEATVAAQVIGTSGSDQSRLLTLDKGSDYGLKPDMAVITPDGAVGKLRDVFPHTSQLLLLSDATSGAGVLLQSTRIRTVLHGSATGDLEITNLTQDSRIKAGEKVLTTGGDQVFPRGLAVGTVESIKPDPEHPPYTIITLKPAANLNQLEEVLVVTATGNTLDPKTEQELDTDAQTRAADITAQRLPSLRDGKAEEDPNAKPDAMPPPDNSTELVPKPKPAVHPDRYSPGSAPPATELTPGAPKPAEQTPPPNPPPSAIPNSSPNDAAPDQKQPQ
jgi:rod shape-determining protein MreC